MTIFILIGILANPVVASIDEEEEEELDREDYDPRIPMIKMIVQNCLTLIMTEKAFLHAQEE